MSGKGTFGDKLESAFERAGISLPKSEKPVTPTQESNKVTLTADVEREVITANNQPKISVTQLKVSPFVVCKLNQLLTHSEKAENVNKVSKESFVVNQEDKKPTQPVKKPTPKSVRREMFIVPRTPVKKKLKIEPDLSVYSNGLGGKLKNNQPLPHALYELILSSQSYLAWRPVQPLASTKLMKFLSDGQGSQPSFKETIDERELMLGIDFGTSCVKVVIGDTVLDKAFAVPFYDEIGIGRFLLPSHIYLGEKGFSLHSGESVYRNLKLSLLAEPYRLEYQYHVVAFLALIIKHARAWLFQEHASVYMKTRIFWRMAVGLPAQSHHSADVKGEFRRLCLAAWLVASKSNGTEISASTILSALNRADELKSGSITTIEEDVELAIVPEIAAQIYGYVASENFDKKAANNFLLVDVGAGTVDTSLFHVTYTKGKWDFEFYTSSVQPFGTMNFNRYRLDWWVLALKKLMPVPKNLLDAIADIKDVTDSQNPLPNDIGQYFSGSKLTFMSDKENPDCQFFSSNLIKQIKNNTFWRAWSENHLDKAALTGIPTYLCGGGMRMPYYKKLETSLRNQPNCSWMKMSVRRMMTPKNLIALGLPPSDYDRLSVAYGLSLLNVGKIDKSIPEPKIQISEIANWQNNYVDKDQC